jgi:hypothetical protein
MEEPLICECGHETFWFFWSFARCTKCFNEYKKTIEEWKFGDRNDPGPEFWMRRFDKKKNQYHDNWEKSKIR